MRWEAQGQGSSSTIFALWPQYMKQILTQPLRIFGDFLKNSCLGEFLTFLRINF